MIFCLIGGWLHYYSLVACKKPVEMMALVACQNQSHQDAIVKNHAVSDLSLYHKSRNNEQLHHVDTQIGALSHGN